MRNRLNVSLSHFKLRHFINLINSVKFNFLQKGIVHVYQMQQIDILLIALNTDLLKVLISFDVRETEMKITQSIL